MMKKIYTLMIGWALFFFSKNATAQVFTDFEDANIQGWVVEGDGSAARNETDGNPGRCLQVNEPATGAINYLVFPAQYLGGWSTATTTDSLFYDFISVRLAGNPIASNSFFAEVSGPGGRMRFQPNAPNPGQNVWLHKSIPLDSAQWVIQSGSFSAILNDVRTVKILAEFINGNELVRFDNIGLSFTPGQSGFTGSGCSEFNAGEILDGWNFQATSGVTSVANEGNPPNCIRIGDSGGGITLATAPPKFTGNWSGGPGDIRFDVKVTTNLTQKFVAPYLIQISGPGGTARIAMTEAWIDSIRNRWFTFQFPIEESAWELTSGTWQGLIQQVLDVKLYLEFFDGTAETVFFDNFCLNLITSNRAIQYQDGLALFFPNPSHGVIEIPTMQQEVMVYDLKGQVVKQWTNVQGSLSLNIQQPGLYFIRFSNSANQHVSKLVVE